MVKLAELKAEHGISAIQFKQGVDVTKRPFAKVVSPKTKALLNFCVSTKFDKALEPWVMYNPDMDVYFVCNEGAGLTDSILL